MGKSRNIARLVVDATGAVDATNLGNAVPADGSITEAKLASNAVTTAKIAAGAVAEADIADSAITTAKIAAGAVVEADIADGAVTTNKLSNSGVTANTYGSGSAIPVITVDAKGRITSASTSAISGGVSSLNGQTGAITNTDYGSIGSYVVAYDNTLQIYNTTSTLLPNTTVAGSNILRDNNTGSTDFHPISSSFASLGLSGTWRRMSSLRGADFGQSNQRGNCLFVRIS